jgi:hypothetical protein
MMFTNGFDSTEKPLRGAQLFPRTGGALERQPASYRTVTAVGDGPSAATPRVYATRAALSSRKRR